jgi:hypothetical protein
MTDETVALMLAAPVRNFSLTMNEADAAILPAANMA